MAQKRKKPSGELQVRPEYTRKLKRIMKQKFISFKSAEEMFGYIEM